MSRITNYRPSAAMIVAMMALFVALGSGAYAASVAKKNSVTSKSVKNDSLKGIDILESSLVLPSSQGPKGDKGDKGDQGVPGTARAYAFVDPDNCTGALPQTCTFSRSKGVTSIKRFATGEYCVTAPGLDAATTPAIASAEFQETSPPEGGASAIWNRSAANDCIGGYAVITERVPTIAVRNAADNGSTTVVADANDVGQNNIGFVIVIP